LLSHGTINREVGGLLDLILKQVKCLKKFKMK
jgi:hypothetical protein